MTLARRAAAGVRARAQDAFPPSSFNEPSTASLSRQASTTSLTRPPSTLKRKPSILKRKPSLMGNGDSKDNNNDNSNSSSTYNTNGILCRSDSTNSLVSG